MKLFFTPLAEEDLAGIFGHIAQERPQTAVKMVGEIRRRCQLIADYPKIGERCAWISKSHRRSVVRRWVIYYRVASNRLEIVRVLDGSRDVNRITF